MAGVEVSPITDKPRYLRILLWGLSGTGKTTLACTAPGNKLLINFDPGGPDSVTHVTDLFVADYSDKGRTLVPEFKKADPFGLAKAIADLSINTVIVDSLTNAQHLSLMHGIELFKGATIERPGLGPYGARNTMVTQLVKNVLRTCGQHKVHCIFIAHESAPERDSEGIIQHILPALGGQLVVNAPIDFSEIWSLQETDRKERRIGIRPVRWRRPCKTRMFSHQGGSEFTWTYDAENHDPSDKATGTPSTIASWYEQWRDNQWQKIPLPQGSTPAKKSEASGSSARKSSTKPSKQ